MPTLRSILPVLVTVAAACRTPAKEPVGPDAGPMAGTLRQAGLTFVERRQWGARPPVLPSRRHTIDRITIHHTGVRQNPSRTLEQKLQALQQFSQREDSLADGRRKPAWADVPYHLYVSTDGRVGEARAWDAVGDSNTPYDPTGHLLVVIEGAFDRDTLTSAQREAMDRLVPALAGRFGVAPAQIATHRDFARTSCPGANVTARVPHWKALVAALPAR